MKISIPSSVLLSILCCSNDSVTAFNVVSQKNVKTQRASSQQQKHVVLSMANNDNDIIDEVSNRRNVLSKFSAAASILGTSSLLNQPAFAAEFSESPTSEASIVGSTRYKSPAATSKPEPEGKKTTLADEFRAEETNKSSGDFDGNEAGSVGSTDEGSQPTTTTKIDAIVDRTKLNPNISLPPIGDIDPKIYVGTTVAVLAVASIAKVGEDADDGESLAMSMTGSAPPAPSYGFSGGRNYWDGVDMAAAKKAGLIVETPPPPPPAPPAPPVEKKPPSKWKLSQPTPYGIANPEGTNPFIKQVLDYCEGGKVTSECADSVKGYLDDIAETGAVATSDEAKVIAGYLESLGGETTTFSDKKKASGAFTNYLDAISEGSAPPPSSGKAVKGYLDDLNGDSDKSISMSDIVKGKSKATDVSMKKSSIKFEMGMASPVVASHKGKASSSPPVKEAPPQQPVPAVADQFAGYDNRLTNIEGRVTSLETKVDALPDQVFAKIETLQSQHESKMSEEVKKIVNALTPPQPAAPAQFESPKVEALIPEPVVTEQIAEVAPVPEQQADPVVHATPIGEIPQRGGMPQAGGSGPKKNFGIGGGGSWKTSTSNDSSPASAIPTISVETPEVEPATPASPIGEIPQRGGMPSDEFGHGSGPKKNFGIGGGASWKN